MLMIEQQIQRQSEVMTPTMQQQNLLLSPALLRHRRLQQLELLAAQEQLEEDTLQNALQTEEILGGCHFSPSTEDMIVVLQCIRRHTVYPLQQSLVLVENRIVQAKRPQKHT